MKKRDKIALSIFAVFYICFGIFITINQSKIVYHPNNQDFDNCPAFANALKVNQQGTRMYVSKIDQTKPIAILYHGNAGSACDRSHYANIFNHAKYSYIVAEYSGYSNQDIAPSHKTVKQDVRNVVSYLEEKNITEYTIVAESIGTGAAAYHTSIQQPQKLLLISPFTTLADIAANRFWFYPTNLMVDNAFDNIENLKNYRHNSLIIHGSEDNIIPHQLGKELQDSLQNKKSFKTIQNAGHNDLFRQEQTYTEIINFLKAE